MYQLCFYVPESQLESVKLAVFGAGAGRVGNYDCCAWQTQGLGQFRAGKGSQPYLGEQEKLETVTEFKVELVCEDEFVKAAVIALLHAHPYEEPAYSVWRLEDILNP